MSNDDNNNNNNEDKPKSPLSLVMTERAALATEKRDTIKAIRALSKDPKWHILHDICHEICATHIVENPDTQINISQLLQELIKEVDYRYSSEPETLALLRKGIPSLEAIRKWTKLEGWNDAVWAKARVGSLFSTQRRASMINALYQRGLTRSDNAAKMYLQMSGDYSEKGESDKDRVADTFREINNLLHNKKNG